MFGYFIIFFFGMLVGFLFGESIAFGLGALWYYTFGWHKRLIQKQSIQKRMKHVLRFPKVYWHLHNHKSKEDQISYEEFLRRVNLCIERDKWYSLIPSSERGQKLD